MPVIEGKSLAAGLAPNVPIGDAGCPTYPAFGGGVQPRKTARQGRCGGALILDDEESPPPGHAFEVVLPTVTKVDSGPCDERWNDARHKQLTRPRFGHHPCRDMDGDATNIVTHHFHFARMKASSYLEPQRPNAIEQG